MWDRYLLTMNFEHRLCGSVPMSKQIVRAWLEAKAPKNKPKDAEKDFDEIETEVVDTIDEAQEIMERVTLGFQKVDGILVVRGGTIRAHFKDCANQVKKAVGHVDLGDKYPKGKVTKKDGHKQLKARVANDLFIEQYFVNITRNGTPITEPDDHYEQPVHVWAGGYQQNALKIINYVERPTLSCTIRILKNSEVTHKMLQAILEYAGWHGYAGERGLQEGRYTWDLKVI